MIKTDFVYVAQLLKVLIKSLNEEDSKIAENIFVNGLRNEYSNFDIKRFKTYLKA
jgi:hypothetical protein